MAYRIETVQVNGSPMEVFVFEPQGPGPHPGMILCCHFPLANTGYLSQSFGAAVPAALARTITKPIADANHAVVVLLIYMAVFIVGSAVLVRARDVSS